MNSTISSGQLLEKVAKAGLNRWKLETLTGLLGFRALQNHQAETEKNIQAENQRVRKELWGYTEPAATGDDMANTTILGDVTHPTPIVVAGQQQSSILPTLAALAIGTMIPGAGIAGYMASQMLTRKPANVVPVASPTTDESLDVGLGRFEDLIKNTSAEE